MLKKLIPALIVCAAFIVAVGAIGGCCAGTMTIAQTVITVLVCIIVECCALKEV